MIRVLIAEDSAVVTEHIKGLLTSDPEISVVGTARNGIEAVAMAENLKPDVITMDIRMPKMDGVEATRLIMQRCPTRIIVVTASTDQMESQPAFEAIKEGALTVLEKPRGYGHADYERIKANLLKTVRIMSTVKVVTRWGHGPRPTLKHLPVHGQPQIVAIGASTGGPAALSVLLQSIPAGLPVPIVIVQHMTAGFGPAFAGWLNSESKMTVKTAEDGNRLEAGTVYIAPDRTHLGVTSEGRVRLTESRVAATYHCPSVNHLFETVAQSYRAQALGVLLTGMGEDGASGMQQMKEAGAKTFCQDEATSIVFGMPKAAIALEAVDRILPLSKLGPAITDTIGKRRSQLGEQLHVKKNLNRRRQPDSSSAR